MPLKIIPDVVNDQTIHRLLLTSTVHQAANEMIEHDVSAMIVVDDNDALIGIVTERDMARRIVAANLVAKDATLGDIMTSEVHTVAADESALQALERMRSHRIRHLPVVENNRVIGMVSMRDLRQSIAAFSGSNPRVRWPECGERSLPEHGRRATRRVQSVSGA